MSSLPKDLEPDGLFCYAPTWQCKIGLHKLSKNLRCIYPTSYERLELFGTRPGNKSFSLVKSVSKRHGPPCATSSESLPWI